jgi:hypothetical protein
MLSGGIGGPDNVFAAVPIEPLSGNVAIGTAGGATVTPEPTFMALTGLGFAGVAFVAYRRRRTV